MYFSILCSSFRDDMFFFSISQGPGLIAVDLSSRNGVRRFTGAISVGIAGGLYETLKWPVLGHNLERPLLRSLQMVVKLRESPHNPLNSCQRS